MKRLLAAFLLLAAPGPAAPYEAGAWTVPATPLDALVLDAQRRAGVRPALPCSDEVFFRRVHLDLAGILPEPEEAGRFLADGSPDKRARLIDALMEREEFADLWSLKWCDLLRVKSEFPVNLWPNAVQAYHRWIRDAIRENRPLDGVARDLLTSSGSNFRDPPVNFWRAVQGREPGSLAAAVALTFLGERFDRWPAERRAPFAALFSRVRWKGTGEWKEEIVLHDPAPAPPLDAALPDGTAVRVPAGTDPRAVFADWLLEPGKRRFARSVANRAWSWFLGRGVVHEPDDLRPDNPPAIPGLLELLAKDLEDGRYDMRRLFRRILNSRTYQQSPIPADGDGALFSCYPVRRLDAEVLADALAWIAGRGEGYSSGIPEPFTFLPAGRTTALADGSITSPFLEMFGRPARDTGLESERSGRPTDAQRLHLLNSTDVQRRIRNSPRLRAAVEGARGDRDETIRRIFLVVLSRSPIPEEAAAAARHFRAGGRAPREAAEDLAWALVNSREFLYRH